MIERVEILAGGSALLLAVVHLLIGRLRFLEAIPRSAWLSACSGISVAYVFMHILPDLAASQRSMPSTGALILAERHIYIVAMIGLVGFYGLERMVRRATGGSERGSGEVPGPGVYHLHIGSFALYNLLIGNLLLHREEATLRSLLLYTLAMGFHFVVTDYGLRQDHRENYHRTGRWILAGAIMLGWGLGMVVVLHRLMVDELFALLAGSVILNVLKEELPEERKSRFSAFVAGAAGYSALLLWWT